MEEESTEGGGVLKGCEPVEIGGGGGGRYATKLNISQSTKGLY